MYNKPLLALYGAMLALAIIVLFFTGCASMQRAQGGTESLPHRPKWESYDQGNLKRHDSGCPTAIYVAPGGNLEECF